MLENSPPIYNVTVALMSLFVSQKWPFYFYNKNCVFHILKNVILNKSVFYIFCKYFAMLELFAEDDDDI